jgi:hypothetical protein
MPSDRSLYRKIEVVLDIAKSVSVASMDELQSEIHGRKPSLFFSKQYNRTTDQFSEGISERVIRKTLNVCRLLGLLAENGCLTSAGREALRKTRYNTVIAELVHRFLRERDINLKALNEIIRRHLQSNPPLLPTSETLWQATSMSMSKGTFARMLTLLAHCGAAQTAQRRIYLRFEIGL